MLKGIKVDEAREILASIPVCAPETETVPLFKAQGRVLAESVEAKMNVPPFDRSPYDGYAVRGEDTACATREAPVVLRIIEELPAGTAPEKTVTAGTAAKILTGAPVPPGANAIIKYEDTEFTESEVRIFSPIKPDTDIIYAGEDVKAGTVLVERGKLVTPAVAGSAAGQGYAGLKVYKKPRVCVMSTGSELLEPGDEYRPAKIYNSNVYTIGAYLERMGAECISLGCVPDDEEMIASKISEALETCDMVVTTGGASVGDYDYALRAVRRAGAEPLFWKVSMKPGGSLVASHKNGKPIIGLSGNPGAAIIALLQVCAPLVRRLCGLKNTEPEALELKLHGDYRKKSPKQRFIRGRLLIENGEAFFVVNEGQGNGVVSSFIDSDLLGEIPAGGSPLNAGDKIKAYRI